MTAGAIVIAVLLTCGTCLGRAPGDSRPASTTSTAEPTPFPGSIRAFRDSLDKGGIKHVYFESPGTAHEWLTWRRDLNEFAPPTVPEVGGRAAATATRRAPRRL